MPLFVKPLITSCQIRYLRKIFHCPKNQQSTCRLFVISFEYLAKPSMNFWHTRHICPNLLFVNIPLCHLIWGFPDCGRILARFPIFSICHFCENCQLWIYLFCCLIVSILAEFAGFTKYVIFVNPTIMDMPLLSSCFKFCQTLNNFFPNLSFRKIAICQDVPFCYLIWIFGQALDEFLARSPFLPKFAFFA